jgi:hypothetical protein
MRHVFVWYAMLRALPVSAEMVSHPSHGDAGAFGVEGYGRPRLAVFHPPQLYELSDILQHVLIFDPDGKDPRVLLSREGILAPLGNMITLIEHNKGHQKPKDAARDSSHGSGCFGSRLDDGRDRLADGRQLHAKTA